MQIQTALFFESPEEIFARVFSEIRPSLPRPKVKISYRGYANANSSIRMESGRLDVIMADVLQGSPASVVESLALILISKLFRRRPPAQASHHFRLYLNRKDVRRQLHLLKQIRGRKFVSGPEGAHYQLEEMFEDLNQRYFSGLMGRPLLGWSRKPSRTVLGHFDPSHNAIILSRILDSPEVPKYAVESVLFHEMLHLKHPAVHRGSRRCVHTREFKQDEKQFPMLKEAKEAIKRLCVG